MELLSTALMVALQNIGKRPK